MAEAIIDRLEVVDVEDHRRRRPAGTGLALDQPRRYLREAAAVEHAGQGIHRSGVLVRDHRALGDHHEDDEYGAGRIKHELDGESGYPDAAGEPDVVGM